MSTPTSRDPGERDPAIPPATQDDVAPDGAAQTPGNPPSSPERTSALGTAGQHAAARPYPPSDPAGLTPTSPGPAPGTVGGPQGTAAPVTGPASGAPAAPPLTGSPADRRLLDDRTIVDEHPADTRTLPADPAAAGTPGGPPVAPPAARAGTETRQSRRELAELPDPPKKPGFGRHLLGILLGLVLTPVALLLTGIGTARLADAIGSGDGATDALGISLLVVGALLLAIIAALGTWSPAVPITGGLVWGIGLGVAYLVVPGALDDLVNSMAGDRVVPAAVEQLTDSAMSGHLLVAGTLLVAAGWATARARRTGRRWAEAVAAAAAARSEVRVGTAPPV